PVWFMRQAGRSLPEYREIRKQYGLFDVVRRPELCAEVTLQPVRRHDVDAAVMFADIMLPVLAMGVDVELVENVGPVVSRPLESAADIGRLGVAEPPASILEAVRIVRRELRDDQAVVGFCGGPFTVAGYLVELALEYQETGRIPPLEEHIVESETVRDPPGQLWIMPAGFRGPDYKRKLARLDWQELYEKRDGYLFIEELKARWQDYLQPDY